MTQTEAPTLRVLSIDDDAQLSKAISRLLGRHGFEVTSALTASDGLARLREAPELFELALLDVDMPEMSGLDVLERVGELDPDLAAVMLTGDKTADTAVKALQRGAYSYLTKPLQDTDAAVAVLRGAARTTRLQRRLRNLEQQVADAAKFEQIVGESEAMLELRSTISRIAPLDVGVLIRGESGTGKELVARALHACSGRASGPFVAINCGAIPENLVDSELFGHAKGAFTGAVSQRAGAFERASGGTLFLDEIGDVALDVQKRLLRVLQEGEILPVGAEKTRQIDVRVVAATLVDLEEAVEAGSFRRDLYYRLNVVSIELPPLRNRPGDVDLLAVFFIQKHAERLGLEAPSLSPEALGALRAYHWPGNVRELENAIQRALALTPGDVIGVESLPPGVGKSKKRPASVDATDLEWTDEMSFADARKLVQERFERDYMIRMLKLTGGNISESARRADLDRSNFRRILNRLGIQPADYLGD